jgi:hypothetical protein
MVKLKDGPKRAMKLSQTILERVLKTVWWRGRKWTHVKKFEVEMFFFFQNIDFPFLFVGTLRAFLFPFFFSIPFLSLSLSVFNAPSLWGLEEFDEKRGEKHSSKISFQMKWNGMAKPWLWNGGVVDILMVDAYYRMELCTPKLLGEASKSFSKNFKTHNGHIP